MYELKKTNLEGLYIFKTPSYSDKRGYFSERFNKYELENKIGTKLNFFQDNLSLSKRGVLRGMHFQFPKPQAKLVSVCYGKIQDVALDIRKNSPTYGKYFSIILSSSNNTQILIPKGFAHGFLVLSDFAIVNYKVNYRYIPENQKTILFNDKKFNIKWHKNIKKIILSKKDTPKVK